MAMSMVEEAQAWLAPPQQTPNTCGNKGRYNNDIGKSIYSFTWAKSDYGHEISAFVEEIIVQCGSRVYRQLSDI